MTAPGFGPRDTEREALGEQIEALLRLLTTQSQHVGHTFAARHGLHATDLEALMHVMDAQGAGAPLTPGQLAARLRLSSGATTAVIDRLERAGHVHRVRDESDRRRVHLHWAEYGMSLALDFFGGLIPVREAVMAPMSEHDLLVVRDFLQRWTDGLAQVQDQLGTARPDPGRVNPGRANPGRPEPGPDGATRSTPG